MNLQEIRGKDTRELKLDLQALRKEQFELKFKGSSEEVARTSRFREIRRTIARIHTILGQRAVAPQDQAAGTGAVGGTSPEQAAKSEQAAKPKQGAKQGSVKS